MSKSPKYKIGEQVVLLVAGGNTKGVPFEVKEHWNYELPNLSRWRYNVGSYWVDEDEIESAIIYNSPLYQALQ